MDIVNVMISKIKPYEKNAKKHPDEQVEQIANSIQEFGFQQPIVVDKKGTIIIGHCRYEAAKKLGLSEVPVIRREDLTDKEARALRIVDNKTNESAWDVFTLAGEIKDIPEYDFTDFGFGNFEILELKELAEPETETTGSTGGSWGVPTGGGLHGKDLSKADVSVNIYAHLRAQEAKQPVEYVCAIGDKEIAGIPYREIVETAREYIRAIGGFERFAEWGLIR